MRILKVRGIEIFPIQEFFIFEILNAMILLFIVHFTLRYSNIHTNFWTNHKFSDI
jgi:hypothetical protein